MLGVGWCGDSRPVKGETGETQYPETRTRSGETTVANEDLRGHTPQTVKFDPVAPNGSTSRQRSTLVYGLCGIGQAMHGLHCRATARVRSTLYADNLLLTNHAVPTMRDRHLRSCHMRSSPSSSSFTGLACDHDHGEALLPVQLQRRLVGEVPSHFILQPTTKQERTRPGRMG